MLSKPERLLFFKEENTSWDSFFVIVFFTKYCTYSCEIDRHFFYTLLLQLCIPSVKNPSVSNRQKAIDTQPGTIQNFLKPPRIILQLTQKHPNLTYASHQSNSFKLNSSKCRCKNLIVRANFIFELHLHMDTCNMERC